MKIILLFLLLVLLYPCNATGTTLREDVLKQIESIKERLISNYCPFQDYQGFSSCPLNITRTLSNRTTINVIRGKQSHLHEQQNLPNILGGLGFNRVTRRVAFPVISSYQVQEVSSVESKSLRFNSVDEFVAAFERQELLGGIFSESNTWMQHFIATFGDYSADIIVAQREYYTHKTVIPPMFNYTKEFEAFLTLLPMPFDSKNDTHVYLYTLLFELFGTSVTQEALYGGVIYLQTAVKKCFGGSVNEDTIRELESNIRKETPGGLSYLRYRRLGIQDIKGGNAELDITSRPTTFKDAPALVRFKYVLLSQVVPREYQEAVWNALKWYSMVMYNWFQELKDRAEQEKTRQFRETKFVRVFRMSALQFGGLVPPFFDRGACGACRAWDNNIFTPQCVIEKANAILLPGQSMDIHMNLGSKIMARVRRNSDSGLPEFMLVKDGKENLQGGFDNKYQTLREFYYGGARDPYGHPVWHKYFLVMGCEPVITQHPSDICGLNHRNFACVCAGY